jgi:gliding motility-associated-like protein
MRKVIQIFIFFIFSCLNAQTAFHNIGNVQIHDNAEIGFHTNLINDGNFDQNLGFTGFYKRDGFLEVSGTKKVIFNDLEFDVEENLYLNNSVVVKNTVSFISGNIVTHRDVIDSSLEFLNYYVHSGEGDYTYVDGYVTSTSKDEFVFPVGDAGMLRPMILSKQEIVKTFMGAYFNENPNNPSTFNTSFDTSIKQNFLHKISDIEFWDLRGEDETEITLIWNNNSDIKTITDNLKSLRVVGWDKTSNKWVDLGGKNIKGDFDNGFVQSSKFIPDNYEIITIGSDFNFVLGTETFNSHNYAFSPNGDGINELFVIEGIELRPNNTLKIINRWGAQVYNKRNYNNTWDGKSQNKTTLTKNKGLPVGVYFYFLTLHDENVTHTGYVYIMR